jgi:hypothetical protein
MFSAKSWGQEQKFVLASFWTFEHEALKFQERSNFDLFAFNTKSWRPNTKKLFNLQFSMPKVRGWMQKKLLNLF